MRLDFDPDEERRRRLRDVPEPELGDEASHAEEPGPPVLMGMGPGWDYSHAYRGGPMVGPDLPRPLYPPDAVGYPPSPDGSDVKGWKRGISRGGRWPWQTFDGAYSNGFAHGKAGGNVGDSGIAGFQRQMGIQATGYLGTETANAIRSALVPDGLPHAGDPLLDATAVRLLEDYVALGNADPAAVRKAISDYCRRSINAAGGIHYVQQRAMTSLGIPPENGFTADCSEHSTAAYFWARQITGTAVPDPNGTGYNGYGYTGTLIDNPKTSSPYQIGDLAVYGSSMGNTSHVCTCYVAGDASSSVWCSHGSEAAPYAVALNYRDDLLCVVRPALVP